MGAPAPRDAPPPRWRFALGSAASSSLASPLGYVPADALSAAESETQLSSKQRSRTAMMQQRAMQTGLAPGKNIFMQGFMMWMSGSSINIFSIMITGMAFLNPVKSILAIDDAFKRFSHNPAVDLTLPKLAFVGCNCGMIALALWKLNTMGLLPITAADWTSFLVDKEFVEASGVPVPL